MTVFRPKLWTASVAILLAAAACSGEGGEAGEAGEAGPAAAVGEGGEGGAEGGAGAGEAGAQSAYTAIAPESRVALRLAHLKGFLLAAQKLSDPAQASALVGQGVIEVYDAQPGAFQSVGLEAAALQKAAQTGSAADINAAIQAVEAAQGKAQGDQAAVVKGLVNITAGLYRGVIAEGSVDPVEYQHAYGAALAAQQVAAGADDSKVEAAKGDIDKLVALFPAPEAPEQPTPVAQVSAQASRIELALS
ncbi:MAG TPA: hypothetical protein VD906_02180 [Caulobacteraceae bacterium]|nr:hypothetical protein [Caulobacteraceae bacterium]